MPLDQTTKPTPVAFYVSTEKNEVQIMVWAEASLRSTFYLSPADAAQLADKINDAIRKMPRIGTPADLGCASL